MVKRTNLYQNKRNTIHSVCECLHKASKFDNEVLVSYLADIREIKSTIQLNRIIKNMNNTWKNLNLPKC